MNPSEIFLLMALIDIDHILTELTTGCLLYSKTKMMSYYVFYFYLSFNFRLCIYNKAAASMDSVPRPCYLPLTNFILWIRP